MNNQLGRGETRLEEVLTDSMRLDRYYTTLSSKNIFWHRVWSIVLLVFALLAGAVEIARELVPNTSGTAPVLTISLAPIFALVCFLVVACASIVLLIYDFSRKAGIYQIIGEQCRDISRECIQMWHQKPLPDHAENQIAEFEIRLTNVTKVEIKNDEALNDKCYEEAIGSVSRIKEAVG